MQRGTIIKRFREGLGLSQAQFASEIGLRSASAVSMWEAGGQMDNENVAKVLARFESLGIRLAQIQIEETAAEIGIPPGKVHAIDRTADRAATIGMLVQMREEIDQLIQLFSEE